MSTLLLAAVLLFPTVKGRNLDGRNLTLPADLDGRARIVIVAFQREQQLVVNSWLPTVRALAGQYPELRYYELPTISRGYSLMRPIIDGGMRGGIKDPAARTATITLYIDRDPFMKQLGIADVENIHVFLLDQNGYIRWRCEGSLTPLHDSQLRTAVAELLAVPPTP
jgi:hypothetical protein